MGDDSEGYLKVSFSGPSLSCPWLLSRTPEVSDVIKRRFEAQAGALGFDLDGLIWVSHEAQ